MSLNYPSPGRRDPFGRLPMPRQWGPEIENIADPFSLESAVGANSTNNRRDVAKVETLMAQVGRLDLRQTDGATGYFGERLKQAVEGFQKDNGLKKDGLINPRGETMRALQEHQKPRGRGAPEKRRGFIGCRLNPINKDRKNWR